MDSKAQSTLFRQVSGLGDVFNRPSSGKPLGAGWNASAVLSLDGFAFKRRFNQQRNKDWHSQCQYLDRSYTFYYHAVHNPYANVSTIFG